jgi:hypothetical protein
MTTYRAWKVLAVTWGHHDQILREPGEVFQLLDVVEEDDGSVSYPPQLAWVPRKVDGKPVLDEFGEQVFDQVPVLGADGQPLHREFAEDVGEVPLRGPHKGETIHLGWQLRVPDSVPIGLYGQPWPDFWAGEDQPPHRKSRVVAKAAAVTPQAVQPASIRGTRSRPVREAL